MSTPLNCSPYGGSFAYETHSIRSGATPDCPNKATISAARCVLRTRVKRRREAGSLTRICTQQRSRVSLAFVRLLKLPNVTNPASRAGNGPGGGGVPNGRKHH